MSARRVWSLPLAATLALTFGCDGGGGSSKKPAAAGGSKAAVKPEEAQPRDTLGKATFDIRSVAEETQKGGRVIDPKTIRNPVFGNTVPLLIDNINSQMIPQYEITNGKYPANAEELVEGLLKPEGRPLQQLPYYLEYGYDEQAHKVVVLEYPERKKERERQRDGQ